MVLHKELRASRRRRTGEAEADTARSSSSCASRASFADAKPAVSSSAPAAPAAAATSASPCGLRALPNATVCECSFPAGPVGVGIRVKAWGGQIIFLLFLFFSRQGFIFVEARISNLMKNEQKTVENKPENALSNVSESTDFHGPRGTRFKIAVLAGA